MLEKDTISSCRNSNRGDFSSANIGALMRETPFRDRDSSLPAVSLSEKHPKQSRNLFFAVFVLICGLFSSVTPFQPMAFGQAEQGTITGAVKDTSGAIVRGAAVNATDIATNTVSSTVSDANGY